MRVVPFRNRFAPVDEPTGGDWQDDELSQILGAFRMLANSGVPIGFDRGMTDLDEPWIVFFDLNSQDVFLHVARIGSQYLLACEALNVTLTGKRLNVLLQHFEAEMRRYLAVDVSKHAKVITHPAAKLMIAMTAVFLLSRLDNSDQALAASHVDDDLSDRKSAIAPARAKQVVTKLYDAADTPTAIAAIAGILISLELANEAAAYRLVDGANDGSDRFSVLDLNWHSGGRFSDGHALSPSKAGAETRDLVEHSDGLLGGAIVVDVPLILPVGGSIHHVLNLSGKFVVDDLGRAGLSTMQVDNSGPPADLLLNDGPESMHAEATEPELESASSDDKPRKSSAKDDLKARDDDAIVVVVREEQPDENMAIDLVETVLSGLATTLIVPAMDDGVVDASIPLLQAAQSGSTDAYVETSYSIDDLASINNEAGLVLTTNLDSALSIDALRYFISVFDDYEVEMADNVIMIEQIMDADRPLEDVGLWSNVMSDGSTIAVVGQISHFEPVSEFWAVA